jgi:hypothetical protein
LRHFFAARMGICECDLAEDFEIQNATIEKFNLLHNIET